MENTEGMVRYTKSQTAIHWKEYSGWKLFINQVWRPATLIAVDGVRFLFQWEEYSGTVRYAEVEVGRDFYFNPWHRAINKNRPPLRWREAIREAENL